MNRSAHRPRQLLLSVLRAPHSVLALDGALWDRLIREARCSHLSGHLARLIDQAGLMDRVPAGPRQHLLSAQRLVAQQLCSVQREIGHIARALCPATGHDHDPDPDRPDSGTAGFALLKGAAYVAAGLPLAQGRLFGDVDILVPERRLTAVESALLLQGWRSDKLDPYDQRYYRDWMHELPPMSHGLRGTAIDVHHSLLPRTARTALNMPALFARWRPVLAAVPGQQAAVFVLPPTDMLLHSATHLFHEGEFDHALRDLVDLDSMLRHFGQHEPGFWTALVPRAVQLGLSRPLFYALRYTGRLLATPVPQAVLDGLLPAAPSPLTLRAMDACWAQVLRPRLQAPGPAHRLARTALYLRSHWLRMPTGLLLRHLLRKAWRRLGERDDTAPASAQAAPR